MTENKLVVFATWKQVDLRKMTAAQKGIVIESCLFFAHHHSVAVFFPTEEITRA
jgi:hypothetical protein